MGERTRNVRIGVAVIAGAALFVNAMVQVASAEDGKAVYDKNCVSCHGAGGKGDGPVAKVLKPPPGDFATKAKDMGDADIEMLIKEGGKAAGKSHAAFGKKLNDEQIKALVQYVKQLAAK